MLPRHFKPTASPIKMGGCLAKEDVRKFKSRSDGLDSSVREAKLSATPTETKMGSRGRKQKGLKEYAKRYPIIEELIKSLDAWDRKHNEAPESKTAEKSTENIGSELGGKTQNPLMGVIAASNTSSVIDDSRTSFSGTRVNTTGDSLRAANTIESLKSSGIQQDRLDISPPGSPTSSGVKKFPTAEISKSTTAFIKDTARKAQSLSQPSSLQELFGRILGDPSKEKTITWSVRVKAMKSIRIICTDKEILADEFDKIFSGITSFILLQLTDRRSQVCKMGCHELEAIVQYRRKDFIEFAPIFLGPLCKLTKVTIKVIAEAAATLAKKIVEQVPDDADEGILQTLQEACNDKARYVRREAFTLLQIMLDTHHSSVTLEGHPITKKFIEMVEKGIGDSDAKARSEAIRVLVALTRAAWRGRKRCSEGKGRKTSSEGQTKMEAQKCTQKESEKKEEEKAHPVFPAPQSLEALPDFLETLGKVGAQIAAVLEKISSSLRKKYLDHLQGISPSSPSPSPVASPVRAKSESVAPSSRRTKIKSPKGKRSSSGSTRRGKSSGMKAFLRMKRREARAAKGKSRQASPLSTRSQGSNEKVGDYKATTFTFGVQAPPSDSRHSTPNISTAHVRHKSAHNSPTKEASKSLNFEVKPTPDKKPTKSETTTKTLEAPISSVNREEKSNKVES